MHSLVSYSRCIGMCIGVLNIPIFGYGRFVSKTESGPMFPLPVRMMMKIKPMTSAVQRMTSWMMSWLMHGEDGKIEAGKVLREINEV